MRRFVSMESYKQGIALQNLRFYAFHGFYPEEQLLGNEFFVDVHCDVDRVLGLGDDLAKTVNYEVLYAIVGEEMRVARKLLETVAEAILAKIKAKYPLMSYARVEIRKMNPPFGGDGAVASVSLDWKNER